MAGGKNLPDPQAFDIRSRQSIQHSIGINLPEVSWPVAIHNRLHSGGISGMFFTCKLILA